MSTPIVIELGQPRQSECRYCRNTISLIKAGTTEMSYKWVTDPAQPKKTWKCPAPGYPVRGHTPREES